MNTEPIDLKKHFTVEELTFIKKRLPHEKIFELIDSFHLSRDYVYIASIEKALLGNILKYKSESYSKQPSKKRLANSIIKALQDCDDYEIVSDFRSNVLLKIYKLIPEPIYIYHARLLKDGKELLKSERLKAAWVRRKNKRTVIFEKTKKRKHRAKEQSNFTYLETNSVDNDYPF